MIRRKAKHGLCGITFFINNVSVLSRSLVQLSCSLQMKVIEIIIFVTPTVYSLKSLFSHHLCKKSSYLDTDKYLINFLKVNLFFPKPEVAYAIPLHIPPPLFMNDPILESPLTIHRTKHLSKLSFVFCFMVVKQW